MGVGGDLGVDGADEGGGDDAAGAFEGQVEALFQGEGFLGGQVGAGEDAEGSGEEDVAEGAEESAEPVPFQEWEADAGAEGGEDDDADDGGEFLHEAFEELEVLSEVLVFGESVADVHAQDGHGHESAQFVPGEVGYGFLAEVPGGEGGAEGDGDDVLLEGFSGEELFECGARDHSGGGAAGGEGEEEGDGVVVGSDAEGGEGGLGEYDAEWVVEHALGDEGGGDLGG